MGYYNYIELKEDIRILEKIATEYPGKTIENIIVQMKARRAELYKQLKAMPQYKDSLQ